MIRLVVPLLIASTVVTSCTRIPAERETAEPDSLMEARMTDAWGEIRDYWAARSGEGGENLVDPQWHLAREFFEYYMAHPDTPTGEKAGRNGLVMWSNLPSADTVESAIARLQPDATIWDDVVLILGNAYSRAERLDEYPAALRRLEPVIENPDGVSALEMALAGLARQVADTTGAKAHYRKVIALGVDPFDVQKAESAIYELDRLNVGQEAPDFEAVDIDGNPVHLASLRGRVVLIEFWATTCGPCMPQIPYLKAMFEELPASEFALIGVADDEIDDLRPFLEERDMTWTQIRQRNEFDDTGHLDQDPVLASYNVFGIPRSFLIDRDGRIAAKDLRDEALARTTRDLVRRGT